MPKRYSDELKKEAVKRLRDEGLSVGALSERLGVSTRTLYAWRRECGLGRGARSKRDVDLRQENAWLRAELLRAQEERELFKLAASHFANIRAS